MVFCGIMNAMIPDPAGNAGAPSEAERAELDSASTLEAIHVREAALTLVLQSALKPRPSSRWGELASRNSQGPPSGE